MLQLELRKIIQVGYRFAALDAAPLLDAHGLPLELVQQKYTSTIAFWLPAPAPFQRCTGATRVVDARAHEIQALKDGAIIEHVQEFEFPEQPTIHELSRRMVAVWEALTLQSLGFLPNGAPADTRTKPTLQLAAFT